MGGRRGPRWHSDGCRPARSLARSLAIIQAGQEPAEARSWDPPTPGKPCFLFSSRFCNGRGI